MFGIILILLFDGLHCDTFKCLQCATPNLQQNWMATGLPLKPDNLVFTDICSQPTVDMKNTTEEIVDRCSTSCFTLLLPIQGVYAMVRGCHEDFAWPEMTVIANETATCEANEVENYGSVQFQGSNPLSSAFNAIRFCKPSDGVEFCNEEFSQSKVSSSSVEGCKNGVEKTCYYCSEYDGSGTCSASTTATCKGQYCTKTKGTLNGRYYETRGCCGFNPFGSQNVCSWSEQSFNVSTVQDSVAFSFKANQCFCSGNECNSSSKLAIILALLIIPVRIFSDFSHF